MMIGLRCFWDFYINFIAFSHLLRYHNILRKVEKDKSVNEEWELIKQRIRDVNAIQTVNAIFQYCPQFLFQSFLIVYRKYKCVITGENQWILFRIAL